MSGFSIITDTGCDIPATLAKRLDIEAVPLKVSMNNVTAGVGVSSLNVPTGFYDLLRKGIKITTSAPNIDDFYRYFKKSLDRGKDILYIGFSSGLSGTYNIGRIAAEQLKEEYPNREILTLDSLCGSMGQTLLLYHCARRKQMGAAIDEVYAYAERLKNNICHWFTVDDLNFLKRGGRISSTTARIGAALNIKPVLKLNDEGKIDLVYKARGKRYAIAKMVEQMGQTFNPDENDMIFINHADCPADAELLSRSIKKNYGIANVVITEIGAPLGAHAGPGALALYYVGNR